MNSKEFYKNHKKIRVPICFYIDEDGKNHYDLEAMAEEFEFELSKLTKTTVMCSIEEDTDGE
jgi:N-acetylmuramoyl-L-alanine amidase CwlA